MLVQKMDLKDLQFAKQRTFDGTMAYAQTKRQQVVMTEQYSKMWPNIHFSCMHPGWADTPGKSWRGGGGRGYVHHHTAEGISYCWDGKSVVSMLCMRFFSL